MLHSCHKHFFAALVTRFRDGTVIMFSLQKLIGHEDKFFTLLEASAEEACHSVDALRQLSQDLGRSAQLEESGYARHRDRQLTQEIKTALCKSFTTAIQREDIQSLSEALYRISKTADKFSQRLLLAPHYVRGVDFSNQIGILDSASDLVLELVKSLREGMNPKHTKELIDRLQALENEADKLMPGIYGDLYSGRYDPVRTIYLKDLFELLEKAIDRCRSAGNIVAGIVLKNS